MARQHPYLAKGHSPQGYIWTPALKSKNDPSPSLPLGCFYCWDKLCKKLVMRPGILEAVYLLSEIDGRRSPPLMNYHRNKNYSLTTYYVLGISWENDIAPLESSTTLPESHFLYIFTDPEKLSELPEVTQLLAKLRFKQTHSPQRHTTLPVAPSSSVL